MTESSDARRAVNRRQELTQAERVQLGLVLSEDRRAMLRRPNYIHPLQEAIVEIAKHIAAHPEEQASQPTLAFDGTVGRSFYVFDPIEGCNAGSGDADGDVRIADARAFILWLNNRDKPVFNCPECISGSNDDCDSRPGGALCPKGYFGDSHPENHDEWCQAMFADSQRLSKGLIPGVEYDELGNGNGVPRTYQDNRDDWEA